MTIRVMLALILGVVALGTGACGSSEDSSAVATGGEEQPSVGSLDEFLAATRSTFYDYEPAETPAVLAERAEAVVTGTIVGVAPGQSYAPTAESEAKLTTSVLEVEVDQVLRGDRAVVTNGSVYVELAHPAFVGTGSEEDSSVVPFDHSAFTATVPRGSHGIFFLDDRTNEPYWDTIIHEGAGRPAGARITTPLVQGFLIEDSDGKLVSVMESFEAMPPAWRELDSLAEVLAGLN